MVALPGPLEGSDTVQGNRRASMKSCSSHRTDVLSGRRGVVAVFAALCMALIIGMAALALDLGNMYLIRGELQRAADAAALAGAGAYASVPGLAERHDDL